MGPATHFLFGALCGATLGSVAVVCVPTKRRAAVALWLPAAVLLCGFWGELPYLVGAPHTTHPLANVCFGYAWLHPWLAGQETIAIAGLVAAAAAFVLAYVVFLSWCFSTASLLRWEREGPGDRKQSKPTDSSGSRSRHRWGR
ncbi:MAG: hypothetical protein ISS72_01740 [Candidatus Brocadiae bacterium]|nr:hypothetical protein [Candidatus Brocadiia bacterium]